ncbi:MMPL family transporter [Actinomycetospora cinnamomea]|uniref:RND superfamily putative drug exporter n=1 Tax=Actinomycetospora cinnamomea TaxID=663609 RepID=A0A2U1F3Y0_9PSEU|nr:MMPL family transporter [Actinomycetospora cinnamomea]PVZ06877.1 RND superfamily putative drug exporter [Actinomycetospora cinnamomea]
MGAAPGSATSTPPEGNPPGGRTLPVRAAAVLLTRGWWAVLALVGVGVWATVTSLPTLATAGGGLSEVISEDAPAVQAQIRAYEIFGLPLLTRIAVVQHHPDGLDPYAQARATLRAAEVTEPAYRGRPTPPLLLAVPVFDGLPRGVPEGLTPGSGTTLTAEALRSAGPTTTIVTYLFTDPRAPTWVQEQVARDYAARIDHPGDHLLGVSGTIPLQSEQARIVAQRLTAVEVASVVAVALVVALAFRSVLAPVITLVAAGTAYVIADHVVGTVAATYGISAPAQLEPVLVALALGLSTDYAVLFLSGTARRLRAGQDGRAAARGAVEDYLAIVVVAGVTVAAGVAALSVARTELFQAFGPGLALTVLAALLVSVLAVPPLLALFGRAVLWPGRPLRTRQESREQASPWEPDRGRSRFVRFITGRRGAAPAAAVGALALLVVCALPVTGMRASVSPMDALPEGNPVRVAWEGAAAGFAPGVLSPTEVLVTGTGVAARRDSLESLQRALAERPGVAGVLGPVQGRLPDAVPDRYALFLGPHGDAARFLLVLDADPLGAEALDTLRAVQRDMPALLAEAGLEGASTAYAGDTALGLGLVESARADFVRVAVVVAVVELVLLVLFLRSLVAPLYLLACSVLVVASSLGLTSLVFGELGQEGLIFFVPFAVGALLASLGSDYNIFGVGDVWQAARTRPLAEALAVAVPRSTRAIGAAGITLAASFGLVGLVPLAPFQELAFAMAVGVLLDTFLVRAFLVPALIWWVGPASAWPSRRLRTAPARAATRAVSPPGR